MRLGILLLLAAPGCGLYFHDNHSSGDDYYPPPPAYPDAGPTIVPDAAPQARCGDGVRSPGEICFGPVHQLDGGGAVFSARALDYDGDGVLDLAYANTDHLAWRRGDGRGNFESPQIGPAVSAWFLASGDVVGDGTLSLVTAGRDQLAVWHRLGADWVQTAQVALGDPTTGLEVGNTDGYPGDEIVITGATTYSIYQLVNGSLSRVDTESVSAVSSLAIGDADDDGKQDGLVTSTTAGWIYYGGVGGVHGIHGYGVTGMEATAMAAADVDGDGNTDVAITEVSPGGITLIRDGTYYGEVDLADAPRFVDTANLDGDVAKEIVTASPRAQTITALDYRTYGGGLVQGPVVPFDEPMTSIHFDGDLDGDGMQDLVVTLTDRIAIVPSGAP